MRAEHRKKPTHNIILGPIRAKCQLVRFKTHLTNELRGCIKDKEEKNYTTHMEFMTDNFNKKYGHI